MSNPIRIERPCPWCRGIGRIDGRDYESVTCRACEGSRIEVDLLCPVENLLGGACRQPLVVLQDFHRASSLMACIFGHRFERYAPDGREATFTRWEDALTAAQEVEA